MRAGLTWVLNATHRPYFGDTRSEFYRRDAETLRRREMRFQLCASAVDFMPAWRWRSLSRLTSAATGLPDHVTSVILSSFSFPFEPSCRQVSGDARRSDVGF